MSKNGSGYHKDMIVHTRHMYGREAGTVDEKNFYKISKIGPKQVTLIRLDEKTMEPRWSRGFHMRLYSKEEADARNEQQRDASYRSFYPYTWSQVFVPRGEAGWDADRNY